jgi:hypothetical protein
VPYAKAGRARQVPQPAKPIVAIRYTGNIANGCGNRVSTCGSCLWIGARSADITGSHRRRSGP